MSRVQHSSLLIRVSLEPKLQRRPGVTRFPLPSTISRIFAVILEGPLMMGLELYFKDGVNLHKPTYP